MYDKHKVAILLSVLSIIVISAGLYSFLNNGTNAYNGQQVHNAPALSFADASTTTMTTVTSTLNTTTMPPTSNVTVNTTSNTTVTLNTTALNDTAILTTTIAPSLILTANPPSTVVLDSNQTRTFQVGTTGGVPSSYVWSYPGFVQVNGCGSADSVCTLTAINVSASYPTSVTVYAIDNYTQSNLVTWNVTINPPLTNVYADVTNFGADGSQYTLTSAAIGGTPPYNYTWGLQNLAAVSGCGTASANNTCTVSDANSTGSTSVLLTITDSATIQITVIDWHVSSFTLSPSLPTVSSEGSTIFTATTTLDSGSTPNQDIETPTITYSWSATNGLSVASCPTTGSLSVTCNIINPVVSSLSIYKITAVVTKAQAVVDNQLSNPDSSACTPDGTKKYLCTYTSGNSGSSVLKDYPKLQTTLTANRTLILAGQSVLLSNITTGGSGGNIYTYILNNSAGVVQNGNTFKFNIASSNPSKYNITLRVTDSIGENATSYVVIAVNESLQINQTSILYPGSENIGIPVFSKDQIITDTDSGAFGGVPPYTYEWDVALPGSITFNPANCGPSATGPMINHVYPCKFATNSSSPLGQYHFQLQGTDGTTPPGSITTSLEPFNLNASLIILSFIPNRTLISAGQGVKFTNVTVNGTGADVWSYKLISGPTEGFVNDGNNKFNFTSAGSYVINLRVTDISGENYSSNATITVTPPLEISLNANRTYISADQSVTLTNTTSGGTGSNQYSYTYDCNGVTQTANKFLFADAGTCKITLHVSDASGEVNQSNVTITVTPPLQITTFSNTTRVSISADQSVSFANTITGGTGSNVWTYFLNGAEVTPLSNGSIAFPTAGTYTVTLGVKDATGEISNSSVVTVTVTPPLTISLNANWTYISAGQLVKLTNITSGGTE